MDNKENINNKDDKKVDSLDILVLIFGLMLLLLVFKIGTGVYDMWNPSGTVSVPEDFYVSLEEIPTDSVEYQTSEIPDVSIYRTHKMKDAYGVEWIRAQILPWGIRIDAPSSLLDISSYGDIDISDMRDGQLEWDDADGYKLNIQHTSISDAEAKELIAGFENAKSSEDIASNILMGSEVDEYVSGVTFYSLSEDIYIGICRITTKLFGASDVVGYRYIMLRGNELTLLTIGEELKEQEAIDAELVYEKQIINTITVLT